MSGNTEFESTMMHHDFLRGANDCLIDAGHYRPWPDHDEADLAFAKVASEFFPDQPMLKAQPSAATGVKIANRLIELRKEASDKGGSTATAYALHKQAASFSIDDRAASAARYYMEKFSSAALNGNDGPNEETAAAPTSALARLDLKNRGPMAYLTGIGQTDMPDGGVVGQQMPHPQAPNTTRVENTLTHLDKQASLRSNFEKAAYFLGGLQKRAFAPGVGAILAAATMAEGGAPGMELMTSVLSNCKTALDISDVLQMILSDQQEGGANASPELVHALEQALAQSGDQGIDPAMAGGLGGAEPPMPTPAMTAPPSDAPPPADHAPPADNAGGGDDKGPPKDDKGDKGEDDDEKCASARASLDKIASKADLGKSMKNLGGAVKGFGKEVKDGVVGAGKSAVGGAKKHPFTMAGAAAAGAAGGYAAGSSKKKEAELLANLKRAAEDASLTPATPNTETEASSTSALAKLDLQNRKPGEYNNGIGKTEMPNTGHVGATMDAPKGPEKTNPQTTPAMELKKAEDAFNAEVQKVASDYGARFINMEKTARNTAILALAGMPASLRAGYLAGLGV